MPSGNDRYRTAKQPTRSSSLDKALFAGLLSVLGLSPLWYGSVAPLAICLNCTALALLGAGSAFSRQAAAGMPGRLAPMIAFASAAPVLLVGLAQATRLSPSGFHNPLYALAASALHSDIGGAGTANIEATWLAIVAAMSVLLAFAVSYLFALDGSRARAIVTAVAAIGTVYTIYGLLDRALGLDQVLFVAKNRFTIANYASYVTSTFINPNHFAAFAGLGATCAAALTLDRLTPAFTSGDSFKRRLKSIIDAAGEAWVPACMTTACLAGVIMSGSRGGIACTLAAAAVAGGLVAWRTGSKLAVAAIAGAFALPIGAALLSGGGLLGQKLTERGLESSDRFAVYRLVWDMIETAPWTGLGLGAFQDYFPLYRDRSAGVLVTWNSAHNSYLELMADVGIPAALCAFAGMAVVFGRCAAGALIRRRNPVAPIAATGAAVLIGLHSLVDFPLATTANALILSALLGAGLAQSYRTADNRRRPKPAEGLGRV